ncbi:MAG: YHYH protein [Actinomycetota bacterium]
MTSTSLRIRVAAMLAPVLLIATACSHTDDATTELAANTVGDADPTADDHDDADLDHDDDDDHGHDDEVTATAMADYLGDYTLIDEVFGTEVTVTLADGIRTIVANSLPNHETGDFPNAGNPNEITEQSLVIEVTTEPTYTGVATFAQTAGVGLNGVTMEPGTAETATCDTTTYRIEALQDLYDLGLDMNNAHVQPGGQYHYHGLSELMVDAFATDDDLVLVGFAADGHLMYVSKSAAYTSSYQLSAELRTGADCLISGPDGTVIDLEGTTPDGTYTSDWIYTEGAGELDECNGTVIDGTYAYVITDEYPYIPRCMMGETSGGSLDGGIGGIGGLGAPGGDTGGAGPPDFSDAAEALGVTEERLLELLPGPGSDLDAAAEALGVTVDELQAVLPPPPGR